MAGGGLDAELVARAVVAAARAYGDDPVAAMLARTGSKRRCLTAAAAALADALDLTNARAEGLLGLNGVIRKARANPDPRGRARFERALRAAASAVMAARNARVAAAGGLPVRLARAPAAPPAPRVEPGAVVTGSPFAGSRVAGRPAPAGLPRSRAPAVDAAPAIDPAERDFVRAARARGVPWPHVAAQLGQSLVTVRRRHDPSWSEGHG